MLIDDVTIVLALVNNSNLLIIFSYTASKFTYYSILITKMVNYGIT